MGPHSHDKSVGAGMLCMSGLRAQCYNWTMSQLKKCCACASAIESGTVLSSRPVTVWIARALPPVAEVEAPCFTPRLKAGLRSGMDHAKRPRVAKTCCERRTSPGRYPSFPKNFAGKEGYRYERFDCEKGTRAFCTCTASPHRMRPRANCWPGEPGCGGCRCCGYRAEGPPPARV